MTDPLSPFRRTIMKRALERAGVNIDTVRPEDLDRALTNIRKVLETFIPVAEVDQQMAEIEGFIRDRVSKRMAN
jgi:hypothetical protein